MYMLFKNNRPVGNKKFNTYEMCRQWARKLARKQPNPIGSFGNVYGHEPFKFDLDWSRTMWRTPTLSDYGYSVKRV